MQFLVQREREELNVKLVMIGLHQLENINMGGCCLQNVNTKSILSSKEGAAVLF